MLCDEEGMRVGYSGVLYRGNEVEVQATTRTMRSCFMFWLCGCRKGGFPNTPCRPAALNTTVTLPVSLDNKARIKLLFPACPNVVHCTRTQLRFAD